MARFNKFKGSKLLKLQGSSNLRSDNLYIFYVPIYFNVHYKSIVTIAMTMSPDFFASSQIQNTHMPPELWLFSALVRQVEVESVTHFFKQTVTYWFTEHFAVKSYWCKWVSGR